MIRSALALCLLPLYVGCESVPGDADDPGELAGGKADDLGRQVRHEITSDRGVVAVVPPDPRRAVSGEPTVLGQVNWELTEFSPDTYLTGVCMASDRVGYAVGSIGGIKGVVWRTIDSGDNWTPVTSSAQFTWPYACAAFPDSGLVVVVGFNTFADDYGGLIMWSHDSGRHWTEPVRPPTTEAFSPWLNHIEFGTEAHGLITSLHGRSFRTDTGGTTVADWQQIIPLDSWSMGFTFLPDGRVWLAGVGIVHSDDFGQTWRSLPRASPVFDGPIAIDGGGFGFTGSGSIAPVVDGWIYRTFDGGQSWSPQPVFHPTVPVRAVSAPIGAQAFAAGGNYGIGAIWSTSNYGDSWQVEVQSTQEFLAMDVVLTPTGGRAFIVGGHELWRRDIEY